MRPVTARALATGRLFPTLDPGGIGRDDEDLSWQNHAACRDADPELFFPEPGPDMHRKIAEAKALCAACPVRVDCLGYALRGRERFGIWGGQADRSRRATRRRTQQPGRRDRDIAYLTAAGLTAQHIAAKLDLAPRTVTRARARLRQLGEVA